MSTYRYSEKIGRGGMAYVYLAMQEGIGGFEKPVVVKRIFPHLCEDDEFVRMFLDEARLAATVRHPNIVEILDIGQDADGFFTVMEYLSGETVAFIAEALGQRERAMPPAIACRIGASVAAGLHHAHSALDADDRPRPIIHRDVTPSNLIVCYNGVVKIVDFGVAKAIEGAEENSASGLLKGKMSYLAPEQVQSEQVDARTDVFQLGIVLHEMLTGQRLFHARTHHDKLMAVLSRDIPRPSAQNPMVPPILDEIVLHALERDRERRLQSADELRRRLEDALRALGELVSDHDLGAWMRETFDDAYAERQAMERRASSRDSARNLGASPITGRTRRESLAGVAATAIDGPPGVHPGDSTRPGTPSLHGQAVARSESDSDGEERTDFDPDSTEPTETMVGRVQLLTLAAGSKSADHAEVTATKDGDAEEPLAGDGWLPARLRTARWRTAVLLVALGASTGTLVSRISGMQPSAPRPGAVVREVQEPAGDSYTVSVATVPATATIELDGAMVGTGTLVRVLRRDSSTHALVITAPGYTPRVVTFSAEQPPPAVIELEALAPADAAGSSDRGAVPRLPHRSEQPAPGEPGTDTRPATDNLDP